MQELGRTLIWLDLRRIAQQVFVQLVTTVLVMELWNHAAQEDTQLLLDYQLSGIVLDAALAIIVQEDLLEQLVVQELGRTLVWLDLRRTVQQINVQLVTTVQAMGL